MASRASEAAARVALGLGYLVDDPVVLSETNNTVVWLRPNEIIAKVGTGTDREDAIVREHRIGEALALAGAPIARPVAGTGPVRDGSTGMLVTLWERMEADDGRRAPAPDLAAALRRLHDALATYDDPQLPDFRSHLSAARSMLDDDRMMAALPPSDRSLLRATFDRFTAELAGCSFAERPLHGEPHDRNFLTTASGVRWIDLEDVCTGPLEWDLAFLPQEVAALFPEADTRLLNLLRTLNSARVATWCWIRADVPEMRRHGEFHLDVIRSRRPNGV